MRKHFKLGSTLAIEENHSSNIGFTVSENSISKPEDGDIIEILSNQQWKSYMITDKTDDIYIATPLSDNVFTNDVILAKSTIITYSDRISTIYSEDIEGLDDLITKNGCTRFLIDLYLDKNNQQNFEVYEVCGWSDNIPIMADMYLEGYILNDNGFNIYTRFGNDGCMKFYGDKQIDDLKDVLKSIETKYKLK